MTKFETINYDEMGKGSERLLVISADESGVGTIICVQDSGIDATLCPCCMLPKTRKQIMQVIRRLGIGKLTWRSSYFQTVPEYFSELYEVAEGEFSVSPL